MEREPEQNHSGKRCADPMTRNSDEPVQTEKDGGDKGGQPITLIGAFAQWINFSNQKNESDDDENDGDPTQLGPKPEPVAFRMNRAPVAIRSGAENGKDVFKIAKTDSAPGGIADQLKDVGKNSPTKIVRYVSAAEIAQMKSLECLPAKEKKRGE